MKKYVVTLAEEEREALSSLACKGKHVRLQRKWDLPALKLRDSLSRC